MNNFLITGAASGIGRASALILSEPGTTLLLHTRRQAKSLENVAEACRKKGAQVSTVLADLSIPNELKKITDAITHINKIDGFLHCAGYPEWKKTGELTNDEFRSSLECVCTSFFAIFNSILPQLKRCDSGARVVACSSFLAHKVQVGEALTPASTAAKAALEALIKSLAVQFAPQGMAINCIIPGYIKKDSVEHQAPNPGLIQAIENRIPVGRLGLPAEVADLVYFLIKGNSNYITGQNLHIDGGLLLR